MSFKENKGICRPKFYKEIAPYIQVRRKNPLYEGDFDSWNYYGKDIRSYEKSFEKLLRGSSIGKIIEGHPSPVVLDFMSPSDALASLFMSPKLITNKEKRGLAITLRERRNPIQRLRDNLLSIDQVSGNLALPQTWKEIERRLAGCKANLILERGIGGLDHLPQSLRFFWLAINRIWQFLDEEGVMLVQTPSGDSGIIPAWVKKVQINGFDCDYESTTYPFVYYGAIKLTKKPGSPENLPQLSQI